MITTEYMRQNLQRDLDQMPAEKASAACAHAGLGGLLDPVGRPLCSREGAEGSALLMLVDAFRAAVIGKLLKQCKAGKTGWDDPEFPKERLLAMLWANATKGDWIDVAAVAMFLHNRVAGWGDGTVLEDGTRPKAAETKEADQP